jgi:hypothetical protein
MHDMPEAEGNTLMRELSDEEMHWLRELCAEGRMDGWPPEHVITSLTARGFVLRRFGAIGATVEGRAAAAVV